MTTLQFADTHNLVAFLTKSAKSEGFEQIVDFLNASSIRYALTVNPTIYTSCIEQFWATVKVKTVNGEQQLQALVDEKKIIITEATVRRDLQLEDADGVDCLLNATIFEQLTLMGRIRTRLFWESNTIIDQTKSGIKLKKKWVKFVMPTDPHHTPIISQPSSSQPQRKQKSMRPKEKDTQVWYISREFSSKEASLGDQEDASKQGRKIYDIDADEDITLESIMMQKCSVVTDAVTILVSAAIITNVELTLAQTLAELRQGFKIGEEANMIEPEKPLKKKDQIKFDEEEALRAPSKNMAGWKPKYLKNKSFANIQELFDKAMKRVNTFVDMDTELVEGSEVRAKDEDKETTELQSQMKFIHDEEEVLVDVIPLAIKPPSIVDWKILKEGKISYY
ncbi:hypothetical protein Tco_0833375 [Tanacetum coccineum]